MKKYEVEKLLASGLNIDKLPKDLQENIQLIKDASEQFKKEDPDARDMDSLTSDIILKDHKDALEKKPAPKKPVTKKPVTKKPAADIPDLKGKPVWHRGENKKWYPGTIYKITSDKEHFNIVYTLDPLEKKKENLISPQIAITKLEDFTAGKTVEDFTIKEPSQVTFDEKIATIEDCRELLKVERSSKAVKAAEERKIPTKFDVFEKAMMDRAKKYLDLVKDDPELAQKVKRLLRNQEVDMKKLIFGSKASLREVDKIIEEQFEKQIQ